MFHIYMTNKKNCLCSKKKKRLTKTVIFRCFVAKIGTLKSTMHQILPKRQKHESQLYRTKHGDHTGWSGELNNTISVTRKE